LLKNFDISIITNTWQRHKQLVQCIEFVKRQECDISWEHIVVSDGPDPEVESICKYYGVKSTFVTRDEDRVRETGHYAKGHYAKDVGIGLATGRYLVLWDDDNFYFKNALKVLHSTAKGYDIGVCSAKYYKKHRNKEYPDIFFDIPKKWSGEFVLGDIDTINVCVSTNLAKKAKWNESRLYEGDYIWLDKLFKNNDISINYSQETIGVKL
jgi:glycosyltransferase involved in cell wall biosynthesis